MILCFGALVCTAGISYLTYRDQKQVAARGYAVYQDDVEEQKGLVEDGLSVEPEESEYPNKL